MNIAHIEEQSFIYGPGCRLVIWVQGCSLHCKGCWNTAMWSFKPALVFSVPELLVLIQKQEKNIEGVTLLGGEPLDQFLEVKELLMACKELNMSTMVFTGYEMFELQTSDKGSILSDCDILITGRYDLNQRTLNHQWIGSTNQEIHFLTSRYSKSIIQNQNYVEISLEESGQMQILGFPNEEIQELIV